MKLSGRLLVWLLLAPALTWAQPQTYNWRFGNGAGITFPNGGAPVASPSTTMQAIEGCASISDDNGVLQCYSNGLQVWDRANTLMPGGTLTGSSLSASQAALLLRAPDQLTRYYLFTVDAQENGLRGGLRYSTIDMTLRGGLGDVQSPNSVVITNPDNSLVAEKLTAVRHANGRDYWVVVHGGSNNRFYCYLLTSAGLTLPPIISQAGNTYTSGNQTVGYVRASPNGQLLATGELGYGVEVFDFNKSSGSVTLRKQLPSVSSANVLSAYCVEFSPDNTKLYGNNGGSLYQFDLSNNYAYTNLGGLSLEGVQRGPDGRLYVSQNGYTSLTVVQLPNLAGAACQLRSNAVSVGSTACRIGLPNFPNDFSSLLAFSAPGSVCANTRLTVAVGQAPAGATLNWNFGDNTGPVAGSPATHVYAQAGTYTITLTATLNGVATTTQQSVTVTPGPVVSLGPRQPVLCGSQPLVLAPAPQPAGTTYRWQDGTTTPTYVVRQPGRYVLTLTSPGGCPSRDSVDVEASPAPVLRLAAPAVLCGFDRPVVLRANEQPPGTTYRWQDGTTTPVYVAQQPGRYRLEVRSAAGCTARDSVVVRGPLAAGECPDVLIPNIIIPGSTVAANAMFQLQGLTAADWRLTIYDRWGREVYRRESYDNSWAAEGRSAGIYYYLLANQATGQRRKGWVEVVK